MPLTPEQILETLNPNGIFYKNPTHLEEAARAVDQSDIVKAIKETRRSREREVFKYGPEDDHRFLPGTLLIPSMSREELEGYIRTLIRVRPNIFLIRISLGNYPNPKQIQSKEIRDISTSRARTYKKTAELIAELFYRKKVVDFVYLIDSADAGRFSANAYAFEVSEEEYNNSEYFIPTVEIQYIPNN